MSNLIQLSSHVQLKPCQPRPFIPRQYLSDKELLANAGGTLIEDTECYPNYFIISFKCVKTGKYLPMEIPFNERKLSWIKHNYTCVGFNNIKYDGPMIWKAFQSQDIATLQRLSNALILEGLWHAEAQKVFGFKIYPTPILDLIEVAPLKGSLKLYAARIHAPRIQELPFPPNQALSDEQKEIVKHYNFNDLDDTHLLLNFMKERIELRYAMSQEYDENLLSKSDAQIAEAILNKKVNELTGSKPKKNIIPEDFSFKYNPPEYLKFQTPVLQQLLEKIKSATFSVGASGKVILPEELKSKVYVGNGVYRLGIGGLHSSEENIAYKATDNLSIVDRDVTSYYPYLVMTLGLYPQSMGPAFLTIYDQIIQSRIADKRAKRTTAANGKKIVVNGAGGKFSDPFSTLYGPDLTIQMTVTGQLDLLLFIETLALCGFTVISANTDGIVTLVPKDKEAKYLECVTYWEKLTGFNTEETRYSAYYARDVNSYFAVKVDAKTIKDIKVKGPYSEVGSQSGTQLDNNPTHQICSDAVKQFLLDKTPIEDTIRNCKDFTRFIVVRQCKAPGAHQDGQYLGKVVRYYYQKNNYKTINYVETGNKVADSEGAKPCLDLPAVFPDDIDYDKYIIMAQEILMDIAYYPRPKQQVLF